MKLVYKTTQQPVKIGDMVNIEGEHFIVMKFPQPQRPNVMGKVSVRHVGDDSDSVSFLPVCVIGAEWIERQEGAYTKAKDSIMATLAARLGFASLVTSNTGADFKEVSVWSARGALEASYEASYDAGYDAGFDAAVLERDEREDAQAPKIIQLKQTRDCIHSEIKQGKLKFILGVNSEECSQLKGSTLMKNGNLIDFSIHFSMDALLNSITEGHELPIKPKTVSQDANPQLALMRSELMTLLSRIDRLRISTDQQERELSQMRAERLSGQI